MPQTNDRMLTVECDATGEVVLIHMNRVGLDYLIERLTYLRDKADSPDHTHLMSAHWGGSSLDDSGQTEGMQLVHHLKLLKW
jgi:hypothetical protein